MISTDVKDLMREISDSKNRMREHTAARVEMIQRFAGPHYRGDTGQAPSPDNYPFAYKTFIKPQLLFGVPACTVNAALEISDAPVAEAEQVALNKWAKNEQIKEVFSEGVDASFFGFGVTKVCVAGDPDAPVEEFPYRTNCVEVEDIPPADFIIDARAKKPRDVRLVGHQFERDLDDVMLDERYDPNLTQDLRSIDTNDEKPEGDAFPGEYEAERKRIRLYELYLPEQKMILTIADKGGDDGIILRQEPWHGPSRKYAPLGPYVMWGLESVSGQLIPISPLQALWDEFQELATHGSAAARSAETHKKIGIYALASKADGEAIKKAESGDMTGVQDPASVKDFEIGGTSEIQLNWLMFLREKLDRNLGFGDAQRGVAAQKTATGEQIAAGNSDMRLDSMRDRVATGIRTIFKLVGWYFHEDATLAPMRLTVENPQSGAPEEATFMSGPWDGGHVNNQFVPPQQPIDFSELHFDVDVRSMIKSDDAIEQKRAQDEILLAQTLAGMGFPVNWKRVLDRYGTAFNVRDYSKIILLDLPIPGMGLPPDPLSRPPGMAGAMLGDQQQGGGMPGMMQPPQPQLGAPQRPMLAGPAGAPAMSVN
jgi:hypothetical protein